MFYSIGPKNSSVKVQSTLKLTISSVSSKNIVNSNISNIINSKPNFLLIMNQKFYLILLFMAFFATMGCIELSFQVKHGKLASDKSVAFKIFHAFIKILKLKFNYTNGKENIIVMVVGG